MVHGSATRRGLRLVFATFVVGISLPIVAGERPAERPADARVEITVPAARMLDALGPGPLPPLRPESQRPADWRKAATVEEGIDQCVESNMAHLNAPGAAVAVMLDGELLYESGYGVKRRGENDPVDPNTIFRIGSVTKQMTAAAVMQQVELGRVDLRAPVTDYIPEFEVGGRWPAEMITVWHTLTHTTGFPDLVNDYASTGNQALSRWAGRQGEVDLYAPPGSFWNYSNPNFMIAGLVAERASGTPYRDLLKEAVWEPAGMDSTTFDPLEVIQSGNFSYGHYYDTQQHREYILGTRDNDSWTLGPAGVAFSTVRDLVRWALLLTDGGGPVLSPASAAMMQQPQMWTHFSPDLYYGFGIMIEEYKGLDVRQHGGNVAGYGTYLLWVPERRFAVALLTNVTSSLRTAAYCIVDEVLAPDPVEPQDLSTDPSTWARYQGDYLMREADGTEAPARVYLQGDRLFGATEDPDNPGVVVTVELFQLYLDTFLFDANGDGMPETDITFCGRSGRPGAHVLDAQPQRRRRAPAHAPPRRSRNGAVACLPSVILSE